MELKFKMLDSKGTCCNGWRVYINGKEMKGFKGLDADQSLSKLIVNKSTDKYIIYIFNVPDDRVEFVNDRIVIKGEF